MQLISAIVSLTLISSTVNAHPHNKEKRGIPWRQPWNWQTQPSSISCPEYSTSTITAFTRITHTTTITESFHQARPSKDWNEHERPHTPSVSTTSHNAPPSINWNEHEGPHAPSIWKTSPPELATSSCTEFPSPTLHETSSRVEPTPSPVPTELDCQPDNCLREIFDSRFTALASEFCMTYTKSPNAKASAIPPYLENCDGDAHAVSSACSCLFVAPPATSAVPAPKESKPIWKETIPIPESKPTWEEPIRTPESWPHPAPYAHPTIAPERPPAPKYAYPHPPSVAHPAIALETPSAPKDAYPQLPSIAHPTIAPEMPSPPKDSRPAPTPKAVYMRALGLGLPLGLSLNLPALGLPGLQNLPAANVLAPVISAVDGLLQCGVQGPASSSCPTRMVGYENDIPMSLIGCYRACEGYPGGCSSYSFYYDKSGSPVCDLYPGTVSQNLGTEETGLGSVWYDLKCGLPLKG